LFVDIPEMVFGNADHINFFPKFLDAL